MQQDDDGQNHTRTRNVRSIKHSGGDSHFKEPVSHSLDASTMGHIIFRYIAFIHHPRSRPRGQIRRSPDAALGVPADIGAFLEEARRHAPW